MADIKKNNSIRLGPRLKEYDAQTLSELFSRVERAINELYARKIPEMPTTIKGDKGDKGDRGEKGDIGEDLLKTLPYGHVWAGKEDNKPLEQAPPPSAAEATGLEFLHLYRDSLDRWRVKWRDIGAIIRTIVGLGFVKEIPLYLYPAFVKRTRQILTTIGIITTHTDESLVPLNTTNLNISHSLSLVKRTPIITVSTGIIDREIIIT